MSFLNKVEADEFDILKLPKGLLVAPSTRSINAITEAFKKGKIKHPTLKPLTSVMELGKYIKETRKRDKKKISGLAKVWGVYIGKYVLIYMVYEHIPGGITPAKAIFAHKKTYTPIADASSIVKLIPEVRAYLKGLKKN